MAQEADEGIAYLMALKNSTKSLVSDAAAAAPARAMSPLRAPAQQARDQNSGDQNSGDQYSGDQYNGAEKRRSPRYKCEGSAEIREEGCEVRTWATFTDISLHGCYVEAQATYPVDTLLHMKLEANGIRVETRGNVRVNYPYLGMGIAFANMSAENADQLRRLLATVSHPCMIMGPGIASSLPATEPLNTVPVVTNFEAAIRALTEFFESRQLLMRDDFLRVLRKSQK